MKPFYFATSWDDGAVQDLRLADLLLRYDLPATFYVPRQAERGVLAQGQIRRLSEHFEIGGHTLNHVVLTRVPSSEAHAEIVGCKKWLEDVTGKCCKVFCFPTGRFYKRHLDLVWNAGFVGARTVEFMSLERPRHHRSLAVMPTTMQAFPHRSSAYLRNLTRHFSLRNWSTYVLHGRADTWLQAARQLLRLAAVQGGVFHLWGHSWELDGHDLWPDLERFFDFVRSSGLSPNYVTNSELCSADPQT